MRTRQSLTVVLTAFIGVLLATIVALVSCAGPGASAGGPESSPTTADPAVADPLPAGAPVNGRDGTNGTNGSNGSNGKTGHAGKTGPAGKTGKSGKNGTNGKDGKTGTPGKNAPVPSPSATRTPARLGTAAVLPPGTDYNVAPDGQTFTVVFSTLEASNGKRSLEVTLPLSGDTSGRTLRLQASGYSFTDPSTTATVTIATKGQSGEFDINKDTDDDFVFTQNVHLGDAKACTVKLTIEIKNDPAVRDATGVMDVLALDGMLR
jgi:hypothetical protein